jgi:hypothetical protein
MCDQVLVPSPYPPVLIYTSFLRQPASLATVQKTQVIDGGQCQRVIRSEGFLETRQCSLIHLLRILDPSLITVQASKVVDDAQRRRVIGSKDFLVAPLIGHGGLQFVRLTAV